MTGAGSILTLGLGFDVHFMPTIGLGNYTPVSTGNIYYNIAMFGIGPLFM